MAVNFVIEAWFYLAIDLVIVSIRVASRWHSIGFRNLSPDDFLMVIAALLYTAETATAHYVGAYWFGMANDHMTPEQRASLDPLGHEHHLRVKGSQTQLFGWLVYTVLLWTLKICWLFLYSRIGKGVHGMQAKVKLGFAVVIITFLATFFTILCGCWPVSKHWQINPDPGNFCQPAVSKLQVYTLIALNLSTDFYIMSIPIPILYATQMSLYKKLGLGLMFCGGIFTAIAGLLRCILILTSGEAGPQQAGEWSCRESFLAVFVSNVPFLVPVFHRMYKQLMNQRTTSDSDGKYNSHASRNFISSRKNKRFQHPLSIPQDTTMNGTVYGRYESDEIVVRLGDEHGATASTGSKTLFANEEVSGGEIFTLPQSDALKANDTTPELMACGLGKTFGSPTNMGPARLAGAATKVLGAENKVSEESKAGIQS